jgi:hypothetical protein
VVETRCQWVESRCWWLPIGDGGWKGVLQPGDAWLGVGNGVVVGLTASGEYKTAAGGFSQSKKSLEI